MSLQTETIARPAAAETGQKVILRGVRRPTWERLLAEHQESRGARFAYDRGLLESRVLSPQSPSLDKRPLFVVLGAGEVWRYDGERVGIFTLEAGDYIERTDSVVLPPATAQAPTGFVETGQQLKPTVWLRRVRAWTQARPTESGPA